MCIRDRETRYAIIENEFGKQGIDNELIVRPDETVVELNNGCLCCTLNENLYDILNELFQRRSDFDEIIIEATGVADPTGLAEPFIMHPLIKEQFPLKAIICLVDAELVEDQLEETTEALNQIAFSDILLINKIDLVSSNYVAILEEKLKTLNPLASIVKGNKDQFPKIDFTRNNDKLDAELKHAVKEGKHDAESMSFPVQKIHSHKHNHTEEIGSHTFVFDTPFDYNQLQLQLSIYLSFQSKGLYRIKGLVWFENRDQQFILQSVGKRFNFQENRLWKENEKKRSVLVFIGKNLPKEGIEKLLRKCLSDNKLQVKTNSQFV